MFSSSKKTQTSVRSLAGAPSAGSFWMKSDIDSTWVYTGSSSRPSMRSGLVRRWARTAARPDASREMTAGGIGTGRPSTVSGIWSVVDGVLAGAAAVGRWPASPDRPHARTVRMTRVVAQAYFTSRAEGGATDTPYDGTVKLRTQLAE